MLKNGAASVISSSDTVGGGGAFIRGGRLNKGGVYSRFLPFGGGAFIRGSVYSKHYGN